MSGVTKTLLRVRILYGLGVDLSICGNRFLLDCDADEFLDDGIFDFRDDGVFSFRDDGVFN